MGYVVQGRRQGGGGSPLCFFLFFFNYYFFACQLPLPHYENFLDKFLKSEKKNVWESPPPPPPPPPLSDFFRAGAKFLGSRSSSETFCPGPKQTPWRRP